MSAFIQSTMTKKQYSSSHSDTRRQALATDYKKASFCVLFSFGKTAPFSWCTRERMCVGLKFIFVFSPLFSSIFVHKGQLVRMRSPVQVWSSAPNPWTKFVHGFFISLYNKDIKARFSTVRSARRHRTAIENTSCSHRLCSPSSALQRRIHKLIDVIYCFLFHTARIAIYWCCHYRI